MTSERKGSIRLATMEMRKSAAPIFAQFLSDASLFALSPYAIRRYEYPPNGSFDV